MYGHRIISSRVWINRIWYDHFPAVPAREFGLARRVRPSRSISACSFSILRRGSMIEEGADTTISFPGRSPKQPLPGIGLHDPLHDWQDCPEFIVFDIGGWSNMSPVGTIFVPFPPKTGNNLLHPRPCQSLNGFQAESGAYSRDYSSRFPRRRPLIY